MFHLRKLISHSTSPLATTRLSHIPSLYRLLSTAAPVPAEPFAVEDYLVTTCGLTRAQALKASKGLSRLRSPSNSDAVLAFLSGLGLSDTDIAAVVSGDPKLLCADVEKDLAKRVAELGDLGLSRPQIARLIPFARVRSTSFVGNLGFWLPVFGSFEGILKAVKRNSALLTVDLEKVAKPNLALLQQWGIYVCNYHVTLISQLLTRPPKLVRDAALHTTKCGLSKGSPMFGYALLAFASHGKEKLARKIGILESFGWSQEDLLVALRKSPLLFNMSEERLRRNLEFLTRDVGLKVHYIAQRPGMVMYSLERRLLPRHCLLKVLDAEGLVDAEKSFYSAVMATEKTFMQRFVLRYKDAVPSLASTYDASSCAAGKVP